MGLDEARSRFASQTREGLDAARLGARSAARSFVTPGFLEEPLMRATRAGQWFAAFLLPVIVPITLTLIVLFHRIIVNLVFGLSSLSNREGTPFSLTLFGLGLIIGGAWFWFQWVRTAGFGLTNIDMGGDA